MGKGGRKNYDWRGQLLAALQRGVSIDDACAEAGIHRATVTHARAKEPAFSEALTAAGWPPRSVGTWIEPFLQAMRAGHHIVEAARLAGVMVGAIETRRQSDPEFNAALMVARAEARQAGRAPLRDWQEAFLARLRQGTSVQAAAEAEGLAMNRLLSARRRNPTFAAAWRQALASRPQLERARETSSQPAARPHAEAAVTRPTDRDPHLGPASDSPATPASVFTTAWPAAWCSPFLSLLEQGSSVVAAAAEVGVSKQIAYRVKRENSTFDQAWETAVVRGATVRRGMPPWGPAVLAALREGASLGVAAQRAGTGVSTVYQHTLKSDAFKQAVEEARAQGRVLQPRAAALRRVRLPLPAEAASRFWSQVDQSLGPQGCWRWTGRQERGWGRFSWAGCYYQAQRAAYEFAHGAIPPEQVVLQECGNRLCVNPDHLVLEQKKVEAKSGEQSGAAKLTRAQVREIRRRYAEEQISLRALGQDYDVADTTIHKVVTGKRWQDADGPIGRRPATKKPAGYWSRFATLEQELRAFLREHKLTMMPTSRQLLEHGRSDLVGAIRRHGGFAAVAGRLQLPVLRRAPAARRSAKMPVGYWASFETLERELRLFIADHGVRGVMPPALLLTKHGRGDLQAAVRQHGGQRAVAVRLGLQIKAPDRSGRRRPHGRSGRSDVSPPPGVPVDTPPARNAAPLPAPRAAAKVGQSRHDNRRPLPLRHHQPLPTVPAGDTAPPLVHVLDDATETTSPMPPLADIPLLCRRCGSSFIFTVAQQERYRQFGWTNEPALCGACERDPTPVRDPRKKNS